MVQSAEGSHEGIGQGKLNKRNVTMTEDGVVSATQKAQTEAGTAAVRGLSATPLLELIARKSLPLEGPH